MPQESLTGGEVMQGKRKGIDRRDFVKASTTTGLGLLAGASRTGPLFASRGSPAEKVSVAVIGVNGRGVVHAQNFASLANSSVAYICDVDSNVIAKAMTAVSQSQSVIPKVVGDFRRVLDDKSVDALAMATH